MRRDLLAEGLHDVRFTDPVARLGAVVRQVRRLLDGERLTPSMPGEHRPLRLGTSPRPDLPIHLAALGPVGVRLTGELADGWSPFLLPASALGRRIRTLEQGARTERAIPRVHADLSQHPGGGLARPGHRQGDRLVVGGVLLTSMGPLYRQTLRDLGHGSVVDDVLAANPSGRTTHVPASADALLDDLTIRGMPSPPGLAWTAGTPPAPNGPS